MKKLFITIVALMLTLIMSVSMVGCSVFDKAPADETPTTETTETTGTAGTESGNKESTSTGTASTSSKKNEVQSVAMAFSAGVTVDATETEPAHVTKRLEAVVEPVTAPQEVDYTVAWQDGASLSVEDVSTYLKVEQDSDGSLGATVKCYKAFGSDTIVITCTTRSRQKQDVCLVTFEGLTKSITLELPEERLVTTEERGTYYELIPNVGLGVDYEVTIPITVASIFGDTYASNAKLQADLQVHGGYQYCIKGGYVKDEEYYMVVEKVSLSTLLATNNYRKPSGSKLDFTSSANSLGIYPFVIGTDGGTSSEFYEKESSFLGQSTDYLKSNEEITLSGLCFSASYAPGFCYGEQYLPVTNVGKSTVSGYSAGCTNKVLIYDAEAGTVSDEEYTLSEIIELNNTEAVKDAYFTLQITDATSGSISNVIKFWITQRSLIVNSVELPESVVI